MSRPALPRASSAMSGFFFCGMIEEPVAKASSSSTQPNSGEVHSTTSSPSRDRCTPISAATNRNSAAKSRSETASIELAAAAVKPSSWATRVRVQRQRRAGQRAGAERADRGPGVPVAQPVQVAQQRLDVGEQLVAERHRLGVLQVGHAGRRRVDVPLGLVDQRVGQLDDAGRPRRGRGRAGTAAGRWRPGRCGERPARSLPPSAPRRSSSPRSRAVCTSSSSTVGRNSPTRRPPRGRPARPASGPAPRRRAARPAASTRACARDAARSYGREPPVELHAHRQPGQRLGRPAGEPAAPQPDGLPPSAHRFILCLSSMPHSGPSAAAPAPRAQVVRGGRLASAGRAVVARRAQCRNFAPARPRGRRRGLAGRPRRIVSSPAIVPTMSGSPDRSSALARNCAAPGGVRSDHEVAAGVGAGQQLPQQPAQPGRRLLAPPARGGCPSSRDHVHGACRRCRAP